ncbi:GNAT family N-acetyltransferase [Actinoplanes sp. NPDC051494]|uniref:GNAT family N-acetyltransferase n=1 Tax=Actinoplanes sp. NPDC051494 TaxID=3363907 RepID=UPI0037973D30
MIRIVHLTPPVFEALARGDLAAADAVSPVPLSAYLADPVHAGTWARRLRQVLADPAQAGWVTGVIWDEDAQRSVGRAGFHEKPGPSGTVEIGYAVDPEFRRRGYARAALASLLDRIAGDPLVHTVRLTIAPDNVPSMALAREFGFVRVGKQWDDEDGLEIVLERASHIEVSG